MAQEDSDKIKSIITELRALVSETTRAVILKLDDTKTQVETKLASLSELAEHLDPQQPPVVPVVPVTPPVEPPVQPPAPPPSLEVLTRLTAVECSNVNRQSTLISSGVPIAQSVGLKDVDRLTINTADGLFVESDIRPAAYWPDGSIKWVQVELLDSIEAGQQKAYSLCLSQSDVARLPTMLVKKTFNSEAWINTESVEFTITAECLIRSLKTHDGLTLTGAPTSFTFDGKTDTFSDTQVRRMEFEYIGSLVCYLVVETVSNSFQAGQESKFGRISTTRRYRFVKNSSLVTVTSVIRWEGTKNGTNHLMPDGKTVNGVLGTSWVDELKLDRTLLTYDIPLTVTQSLRANRKQNREKTVEAGMISATLKSGGKVIAGLRRMDLYEPQSLSYLQGSIKISHATDKFWLSHHQGTQTTCVIGVTHPSMSYENLLADLNHPVRLFCPPSYYEVAGKPIPTLDATKSNTVKYSIALAQICSKTIERIEKDGLYGLMTYAWWPRSWDDSYIEAGAESLTTWDGLYKTGAFTDYYSTSRSAVMLSLMTQNSLWLDNLAHPSTLRMLYTQIMQTAPDDPWVYGGWAPSGYGCGRSDFNSSHSYYENLFWYYYLTGDRGVIDVISRGEERMIREVASQSLAGRFPHQRLRAWRFLSQVHPSSAKRAIFELAWKQSMQRAIDQCYVQGTYQGEQVAFWVDGQKKQGVNTTPNLYAMSIWDLESLWEYGREISTSSTPAHPWQLLTRIVKTIQRYGSTIVGGDSTFNKSAKWARAFSFTWDGNQTITDLKVSPDAENSGLMYPGDLPGMCASWARAAMVSGDAGMKAEAQELVSYTLEWIKQQNQPMNKVMGLADSTLADAVSSL